MALPTAVGRRGRRCPARSPRGVLAFTAALYTSLGCIGRCDSFVVRQKSWDYKGHHIGWEEARLENDDSDSPDVESAIDASVGGRVSEKEPILLLNGFGVGSFHQHRLMPELAGVGNGQDDAGKSSWSRVVYGVDYLGQGRSWPVDCDDGNSENERGLRYCIDTWADQVISFVEDVVLPNHAPRPDGSGPKVHLVGNSVGGHLSVLLASKRPDLVRSICLLNATPVWGLNLPGWSGRLPPPAVPRRIGRYLFDRIRDLDTIDKYLGSAYANRDAFDVELCRQIRACTEGKGGHAAFASILWSPPATFPSGPERTDEDFYSNLQGLDCDVLLVFGKNDPWCKPAFARRMNRALAVRPEEEFGVCHRYIEVDNVGHCPNHEAPRAVGKVVRRWIEALERGEANSAALIDSESEIVAEPSWGGEVTMKDMTACHTDGNMWVDVSLVDRLVSRFL